MMNGLPHIKRFFLNTNNVLKNVTIFSHPKFYSKEANGSDEEKDRNQCTKNSVKKLNDLLKNIADEELIIGESNLELAKPLKRRKDTKGGEVMEQAELNPLSKEIIHAAQAALGDKKIKSELLQRLFEINENHEKPSVSNLNNIVKSMPIEKKTITGEVHSRANQVRAILQHLSLENVNKRKQTFPHKDNNFRADDKIQFYKGDGLGIFSTKTQTFPANYTCDTWQKLYQRELTLAVTHPPSNYFQQMILWTEQGKVWKFPLDNEQGMENEQNIYFSEHVFLEKYLESWCPARGPLRHFMDLVCVGLSKNPYLTISAKKDHIEWFKNYFEDKKQLLSDVGVLGLQS